MTDADLEQILLNLPQTGTLVLNRHFRQVWRFEHAGQPCYLKFYPRLGWREGLRRVFRGSPALRERDRLQRLLQADVPAPRPLAIGLDRQLGGRPGDVLVLHGIEPSLPLDKHLHAFHMAGQPIPYHLDLARKLIDLLDHLRSAGLGHNDLHAGNILLSENTLYLLDAYDVHPRGLGVHELIELAFSLRSHATRTDLLRAWRRLGQAGPMPLKSRLQPRFLRKQARRAFRADDYFGHLHAGPWRGHFFKRAKFPRRWAPASHLAITEQDWRHAWPELLRKIDSDQLDILKRGSSGDVLATDITLAGQSVPVVVKRPRRKFWYRYINELGRGSRPRRAWKKAWQLVVRDVPTAWPLLFMEKRVLGYPADGLLVFERIAGRVLATIDPASEKPARYHQLLHRCGTILRHLEETGLFLYDAKPENWIVRDDPALGLCPMLVDVESVRTIRQNGGLPRLLRGLRSSPAFSREHALALARGYEPFAASTRLLHLARLR